jgi:hypothetical protein
MGLLGFVGGLALLIWFAFRGWGASCAGCCGCGRSLRAGAQQWSVVTLLAICGSTHRESYFDIAIITNCSAAASRLLTLLAGRACHEWIESSA